MGRHLLPRLVLLSAPAALLVGACVGDDPVAAAPASEVDGGGGEAGGQDADPQKPTLAVVAVTTSANVLPSASVTVDVTVTRGGSLAGPVKVSLTGLPGGVTAEPLTIAANETRGRFTLAASASPTQGVAIVGISAQSSDGAIGATAVFELVVRDIPGSLDTSFASTGGVADASLLIEAVTLQKDGKIVLGGSAPTSAAFADNYVAVRLDTTGKLDATFATGGRFKATLGVESAGYSNYVTGVAVFEATGNIVIGGSAVAGGELRLGAMRLDKNGKQDKTFGVAAVGGAIGPSLARGRTLVSSGGDAYVVGYAASFITGPVVLGRLGPSGFDAAFGTGGMATATGHSLVVHDAAIQSDGKVLVCGQSGAIGTDGIATILRLDKNGAVDLGYGTNGEYTFNSASKNEDAMAMALLPDDRVVVVGTKLGGGGAVAEVYVDVILPTGKRDAAFGGTVQHVGDGDGNAVATAVAVQQDGLIVLAGYAKNGTYQGFLWRLLKNGTPDPAFNGGVPVRRPVAAGSTTASGAVIDGYNRVVVTTESSVTRTWL